MPSNEYLQAIFERAKAHLSKEDWEALHRAAMPSAGGKASWRTAELSEVERLALRELRPKMLRGAKAEELQSLWTKLSQWHARASRRREDAGPFAAAAGHVLQEMQARGIEVSGPLADAARGASTLAKRLEQLPEVVQLFAGAAASLGRSQDGVAVMAVENCDAGAGRIHAVVDAALEAVGVSTYATPSADGTVPLYDLALVRSSAEPAQKSEPLTAVQWLEQSAEMFAGPAGQEEPEPFEPQPLRVLCAAPGDEKQVIYYIVSEPNTVDAHGHRISAEDVEKALWGYIANSREVKLEHGKRVTGRGVVVEGYVAPCELETFHGAKPPDGPVKKGTSIVAVYWADKALWDELKSTPHGASWGGYARRVER